MMGSWESWDVWKTFAFYVKLSNEQKRCNTIRSFEVPQYYHRSERTGKNGMKDSYFMTYSRLITSLNLVGPPD